MKFIENIFNILKKLFIKENNKNTETFVEEKIKEASEVIEEDLLFEIQDYDII